MTRTHMSEPSGSNYIEKAIYLAVAVAFGLAFFGIFWWPREAARQAAEQRWKDKLQQGVDDSKAKQQEIDFLSSLKNRNKDKK